jgi:hypothetical protein
VDGARAVLKRGAGITVLITRIRDVEKTVLHARALIARGPGEPKSFAADNADLGDNGFQLFLKLGEIVHRDIVVFLGAADHLLNLHVSAVRHTNADANNSDPRGKSRLRRGDGRGFACRLAVSQEEYDLGHAIA